MNDSTSETNQQPQPQPPLYPPPPHRNFESNFVGMYRDDLAKVPRIAWCKELSGMPPKEISEYLETTAGLERLVATKSLFACVLSDHEAACYMIVYSPFIGKKSTYSFSMHLLESTQEPCHDGNTLFTAEAVSAPPLEHLIEEVIALAESKDWKCRRSKFHAGPERFFVLTS